MSRFIEMVGIRYGRLTVLREESGSGWARKVCVRCECGVEKAVYAASIRKGLIVSCGCFRRENMSQVKKTHGETVGTSRKSEYLVWAAMKQRCANQKCKAFKHYGGRGITVCQRWRESFDAFLADMGRRPSPKHTLERSDNDGNYEPTNCRWATWSEQASNRRRPVRQ